jgi:hypothetical protein
MKEPATRPTNHRLIYGIIGILVFGSVAALFTAEESFMLFFTAALVLHFVSIVYMLMLAKTLPPPLPNPHRFILYGVFWALVFSGILALYFISRLSPVPEQTYETVLIVTLILQGLGLAMATRTIPPPVPNPHVDE